MALALAGKCLSEAERHEAALAYFHRAAAESPRSPEALTFEAQTLLQLGRTDQTSPPRPVQ